MTKQVGKLEIKLTIKKTTNHPFSNLYSLNPSYICTTVYFFKDNQGHRKYMQRIIPYPLFFIMALVLDRVVISSSQIGIGQSLRALIILLLSAMIIAFIIQHFTQDWQYTYFIVLMIPAALMVYQSSYRLIKINFPHQANNLGLALIILLGIAYVVVVRRKTWKSIRNPRRITTYFSFVFALLLSFQVVRLWQDGYYMLTKTGHKQTTSITGSGLKFKLKKGTSPDIYIIVLDAYARQDVLQKIYKHDNSEFIDQLEKRDFYVANDTHSNYVQTPYVMASFWNLDYLQTWDSSYQYAQYLYEPIQNNRVFHSLDEIGYTTVSFEGAVHFGEIKNADVYLSNFLPLNNFETFLLVDSPVEPLSNILDLGLPVQTYKTHRQRILYQLDMLKKVPASIQGPKIVYVHILAPHPPFVFYHNGDIREPEQPYTLAEGLNGQGIEEYWKNYQEQVNFINSEMLKVIDAILNESESLPIILLMGDHGPASMFKFNIDAPECLWERTSNLYAIFLPGHENDDIIYPSISPVNTFRLIFNTYFGTDLPLLEDRSYHMDWRQPTLNVDITTARDTLDGCIISSK